MSLDLTFETVAKILRSDHCSNTALLKSKLLNQTSCEADITNLIFGNIKFETFFSM